MRTTIGELRVLVRKVLLEMSGPRGKLRPSKGGRQYKIGKVEDENRELSSVEAEHMFPDSTEAWAEIAPGLYPEFPYDPDSRTVKRKTTWFMIGNELQAMIQDVPDAEPMKWDPQRMDWFPIDDLASPV